MVILGIDPGLAIVGYGFVDVSGNRFRTLSYGAIKTDSKWPTTKRLKYIFDELTNLIEEFKPENIAIEELFFNTNAKTVINVGQARGVQILAASCKNIEVYEYTPLQIKQAITGYGRADKQQMQQMIKMLLNLEKIPKPDDVADALAVAFCHGTCLNFKENYLMK